MSRSLSVEIGLLRRARDFRLLFLATLASSVGTWLAFVALVVDVYDRTGSASWISALLVVEFAPFVVIGLLAGPLLDRLPRRKVMVSADLARAAIFSSVVFATDALQIVILALLAGIASTFFRPSVYAGLPNLVHDDDLPRANGFLQAADNVTMALGPLLGGVLVATVGPHPAYAVNAASFVVSAGLILAVRHTLEEGKAESQGHWRDLVSGLRLVRSSAAVRTVVVAWSVVMLSSAGISVAEVFLAKEVFHGGDFGYGLFVSAAGVGLVFGSLVAGSRVERRSMRHLYAGAIALMAVGFGAAGAAPSLWSAAPLLVVGGFGNGFALVCNGLLIQRGVPDRLRGRAFTVAMSLTYAALGLGMIVAGPITGALGARGTFGLSAGLCLLAAPVSLALARQNGAADVVTAEAGAESPVPTVSTGQGV